MDIVSQTVGWLADPANWQGSAGIPSRLVEHVLLSGMALAVALAVAVPIGLYVGHTGRGGTAATNVAGLGRAIPSYALLLLFFPIFGFGLVAPLLALVLLALPAILANVYVGLRGVDRELVDAGRGMGMRESEILIGVELPAALPVILAGIRTAAVAIVATATLAALIGGGGLGRFIVDGFALQDDGMLVSGALLVAILAVVVERGFTLAERRLVSPAVRAGSTHLVPLA
ncbi:MAG TPA: ABC transporter permease subunit [Candidatus Limnocylindrales bacterium]|nr:ABC transporter permease subunit [Candidatus Limnocylindrales bacterium]